MAKRKTLTCAEHEDLGARVKAARALLVEIALKVSNGLGTSSAASKFAFRILNDFDLKFKDEISRVAGRDCPELDAMDIYYGPTHDNKVVHISQRLD